MSGGDMTRPNVLCTSEQNDCLVPFPSGSDTDSFVRMNVSCPCWLGGWNEIYF
uniref:Uncharacterized protein n=1 Tax=Picea glauca TaxID=3330 RepID=A0A101LWN6_PICGL|nr:hypothetical protein ABT39_MTgene1409 [Picea glauca]QHR92393.1 hypothetical protein Q903MT_gene6436 [Picea sitchensis]